MLHYRGLLALAANIRLGWKGLPGTDALAYYGKAYLTAVKSYLKLFIGCKGLSRANSIAYFPRPSVTNIQKFNKAFAPRATAPTPAPTIHADLRDI